MLITLVLGDITTQPVDAIVNAANSSLLGGSGVDGGIHRKGGPAILEECRKLRASHYGKGLRTGQAVATTGGNLPARWVVHTAGHEIVHNTILSTDVAVEIPMVGKGVSLNVAVADSLVLYRLAGLR